MRWLWLIPLVPIIGYISYFWRWIMLNCTVSTNALEATPIREAPIWMTVTFLLANALFVCIASQFTGEWKEYADAINTRVMVWCAGLVIVGTAWVVFFFWACAYSDTHGYLCPLPYDLPYRDE